MVLDNKRLVNMLKELKEHKLLYQTNIKEDNSTLLKSFYYGIDPNASFIHIGHISSLLAIKIINKYIEQFILVIGEGTVKVGDPTAKTEVRDKDLTLNYDSTQNSKIIESTITKILDNLKINYIVVRNSDWLDMPLMQYLHFASFFNIKAIYNSEIFKNRLEANKPIYLHEFLYPTLQAYDYLHLYSTYECTLQIGGQDQWTNILSGGQLIRQVKQAEAYALTMPLIVDENNNKIGKSTGGSININLENNIFMTLNNLLEVSDYIQSQISVMSGVKFENYKSFAKFIISLLYGDLIGEEVMQIHEQIINGKIDINIKADSIDHYIPRFEIEKATLNGIVKRCLVECNSKMVDLYLSKGFIIINGINVTERNIKSLLYPDKINVLKIKNSILAFYVF